MTVLLAEMTRDKIEGFAPEAVAVLCTAAIEQHGPHLPIVTDRLLCETVTRRAAERAASQIPVAVAPILAYGNSHHHYPFAGTLSLTSHTFMAAVTELLEGLKRSGFRKLAIVNGHGGNVDSNGVVSLDFVNRLGHDVSIATASYWDIARPALVESGIIESSVVPGHAGLFETALVMALRPDLVDPTILAGTKDMTTEAQGLFASLSGATAQRHGAWAASTGYTDNPKAATAQMGESMLEIIVQSVADFLVAFYGA